MPQHHRPVKAEGKPEAEGAAAGGKYDSRKFKFVERVDYSQFRNFVVYLDGPITNASAATNALARVDTKRVKQEKANFSPSVLPVVAEHHSRVAEQRRDFSQRVLDVRSETVRPRSLQGQPAGKTRNLRQGWARRSVLLHSRQHALHGAGVGESLFRRGRRKVVITPSPMFRPALTK